MSSNVGKQTRTPSIQAKEQDATHAPGPGKQSLVGASAVQAAAARGVATPASALPHGDAIQRSFGHHDISSVQAHTGPDAAASADAMGADAYATGDHVVLGKQSDLFTAAHEAAHVVQQREGVHLKGGVGEAGDAYEQHADAVASKVVQGESAEDLLGRGPGGGGGGGAAGAGPVQRSGSGGDAQSQMDQALNGGQQQGNQPPQQDPPQQQPQQVVEPDVTTLPAMNIGGEVGTFRGESDLAAAIVEAQEQMAENSAVAAHTIALFQYLHAKAGTLEGIIDEGLARIPAEEYGQKEDFLKKLSEKMSPKLGDKGLWVGPERMEIYLGMRSSSAYFKEGKELLLQKAGEARIEQRSIGDLLKNHSNNMEAKSYGRRAESLALINVKALPVQGGGAAKPKAHTPIKCDDGRCQYFDDAYTEVAGNALVVGETYSLYFNGADNLSVTVESNDGTTLVFSNVE